MWKSAAEPIRLTRIPFAERLEPAGEGTLTAYGCEGAESAPGRERVYRVHVEETTALEVNVFADQGARTYLLGPELNALHNLLNSCGFKSFRNRDHWRQPTEGSAGYMQGSREVPPMRYTLVSYCKDC